MMFARAHLRPAVAAIIGRGGEAVHHARDQAAGGGDHRGPVQLQPEPVGDRQSGDDHLQPLQWVRAGRERGLGGRPRGDRPRGWPARARPGRRPRARPQQVRHVLEAPLGGQRDRVVPAVAEPVTGDLGQRGADHQLGGPLGPARPAPAGPGRRSRRRQTGWPGRPRRGGALAPRGSRRSTGWPCLMPSRSAASAAPSSPPSPPPCPPSTLRPALARRALPYAARLPPSRRRAAFAARSRAALPPAPRPFMSAAPARPCRPLPARLSPPAPGPPLPPAPRPALGPGPRRPGSRDQAPRRSGFGPTRLSGARPCGHIQPHHIDFNQY